MKRYALFFLVISLAITLFSGIALAADFTLTPTKLSFANQAVGTPSTSQALSLKNTASGSINFTLSPLTDYSTSSDCSGTVIKGASCTINVSFSPTTTGNRAATLTVSDGVTSIKVALSGTSVLATTISPTTLAFGSVAENSSSPTKTITLTNNQGVALNLIRQADRIPITRCRVLSAVDVTVLSQLTVLASSTSCLPRRSLPPTTKR